MKELYKYKDRVLLYDTETKEVKELDKKTARKVLDSRANVKDSSFDEVIKYSEDLRKLDINSDEQTIRSLLMRGESIAKQAERSIEGLSREYNLKLQKAREEYNNENIEKQFYKARRAISNVQNALQSIQYFFEIEIKRILTRYSNSSGRVVSERFPGKTDKYLSVAQRLKLRFTEISRKLSSLTNDSITKDSVNDGRYDNYYGEEEANKYGAKIIQALRGKTITKRRDKSNQPGGLEYEAKKLGIDMWDFLRALEGLCYQGKAEETSDSTYRIKDSKVKDILEIYDDTLIIVTDEKNRVVYKGIVDYAPKEVRDGRWHKGANNKTFTINSERGVLTVKVLDSSVRDSVGVRDAMSESQALENFKRFLKKHYEYTDEDLKKVRVELEKIDYPFKKSKEVWYGLPDGRVASYCSLDGKKWEVL